MVRRIESKKIFFALSAIGIIYSGFALTEVGPAGLGGQPLAHAASISLDTNSSVARGGTVSTAVGKLKKLPSAGGGGGVPTVPAGKVVVAACLYHHTPNANNLPTKFTQVNVVRGWTTLWSGLTGSDGCFTSGELSKGSGDLKIVLEFESRNSFVYVFDSLGITFSAVTDEITISADGYRNLGGYLAETDTSAPFHVLSVMVDGWAYAQKNFGLVPPPVPVRLSTWDVLKWTMESSFYTDIPLERIVINSKAEYQDQWDDFVILHEYGHFLAKKFFSDGSPGGPHGGQDLTGEVKDSFGGVYSADEARRLAWGEGWATFFAALVSYGNNQAEVAYVDTVYSESGTNPYEVTYAIEGTWRDGADNEDAVAATLWDIYDAYNFTYLNNGEDAKHDARDTVTLGIAAIIDVLKNYKVDGHSVYTISDFYTGWFNCPLCQTKNHGGKTGVDLIFYGFDTYQFSCTDADGDGYKTSPCSLDCNDGDRSVNPGATEVCDGKDNNCDGVTDPLCACRDGQTRACGTTDTGACQRGVETCRSGLWGSCTGNIEPVTEGCNRDGLDNDCDGVTDDLQSTCDYRPYCADFTSDTAGSDQHSYIKKVFQGSYCPNPWKSADIDNDGYAERYLLLGPGNSQFVRVWESCRPQVDFGWHVYDFWDGSENSLGCTIAYEDLRKSKSYCSDSGVEYTYVDLPFTSPTDNIVVPEMRCVADDPGQNWWAFWDYRMQWNYSDGHQEPALILRCGQDADCKTGEYCQKPVLANPLSYRCASKCGNGICDAGEACPADSQGGETCDSKDNNCNGYVDDGLPIACRSDADCLPDGCYAGGSRDYRCVNAGTCGSRCEHTEKKTDQDGDGFTVECGKDCNDANAGINPSRSEQCDGIDNDCSGVIDDHLVEPLCELQTGVCTDAVKSCGGANGWFACGPYEYGSQYEFIEENISDTVDNDCDGRIDIPDITVSSFIGAPPQERLTFDSAGSLTRYLMLPRNAEMRRGLFNIVDSVENFTVEIRGNMVVEGSVSSSASQFLREDDQELSYSCQGSFQAGNGCGMAVDEDPNTYARAQEGATAIIEESFAGYPRPRWAASGEIWPVVVYRCTGDESFSISYWDYSTIQGQQKGWQEVVSRCWTGPDDQELKDRTVGLPWYSFLSGPLRLRISLHSREGTGFGTSIQYFETQVRWFAKVYPANPSIEVGTVDGSPEWYVPGQFRNDGSIVQDTLSDGLTSSEILFSGGQNQNVFVTLPKYANVFEFLMALGGYAVDGSYPSNTFLEVGTVDGIREWFYPGVLTNDNISIGNQASSVLRYLQETCSGDENTLCLVPLTFHSDTPGILELKKFHIYYGNRSLASPSTMIIHGMPEFSQAVNSILPECSCQGCQLEGSDCKIPVIFRSESAGELPYGNMKVVYYIPHCANEIFDGDEKGVDCGGSCTTQCVDSDNDCLPDSIDACPNDADCDDDGLVDGSCGTEDRNANGRWDLGETNPMNPDTDYDGIQDGTELGLTQPQTTDTDLTIFVPDSDPATVTSATNSDSDNDGVSDGTEDGNGNGGVDAGEASPTMSDADADGVEDGQDNCPASANVGQADDDQDGLGNVCDNCVAVANSDQRDTDADFRGDACEDTTPPVLVCPPAVTAECAGPDGQTVTLGLPQAADDSLMSPQVTDDRPVKYTLGETQVTFTARDQDGNTSVCSITVTITDTTPPTLVCPPGLTALEGSEIDFGQAGISDACHVQLTDPPAPQVQLQIGENEITWSAADPSGNVGACTQTVTIAPDPDRDGIASSSDNCPDTANPGQADVDGNGIGDACEVPFIRGDANVDGDVDIADAVYTLFHLFRGGPAPSCYDRMDVNDDGTVNLTDPVHLLNVLFKAEGVIAPPAFATGLDLTKDALVCR